MTFDDLTKMRSVQCSPQLIIRVFAKRIQICTRQTWDLLTGLAHGYVGVKDGGL